MISSRESLDLIMRIACMISARLSRGASQLLTHQWKGSKVDEEALRDRFPLRQSTEKGLQMGSRKNRGLRWRKGFLFYLSSILGIFGNL